jgi:hypothetical protein
MMCVWEEEKEERKRRAGRAFGGEKGGRAGYPETHLGHKYFHAEFSPVGVSALGSPSNSPVSPR